jgi:hypothetical protein
VDFLSAGPKVPIAWIVTPDMKLAKEKKKNYSPQNNSSLIANLRGRYL